MTAQALRLVCNTKPLTSLRARFAFSHTARQPSRRRLHTIYWQLFIAVALSKPQKRLYESQQRGTIKVVKHKRTVGQIKSHVTLHNTLD